MKNTVKTAIAKYESFDINGLTDFLLSEGLLMVNGRSDDFVELDGLRQEELDVEDKKMTLNFEDGTIIEIKVNKSLSWKIKVLEKGSAEQVLVKQKDLKEFPDSDIFFIKSNVILE